MGRGYGSLKGATDMETKKFEKNPIMAKFFIAIALSALLILLAVLAFIFVKPYGTFIAIALIIISFFVDIILIFRVLSSANCPQCARPLKRKSLEKGEYPCEVCGINWVLTTQEDAAEE